MGFFDDMKKVNLWLKCPNPLLGGLSPQTMIEVGRIDKLIKFVETEFSENRDSRPWKGNKDV